MIKGRTAPMNIFLHLLLYFVKFCYILKNLVYIVIFVLLHLASYWKCSKKAPTLIQICTGFVDAVLRPKILVNRVGILTQILIAVNYCFFIFQISTFNLEKNQFLVHLIQITGSTYCGVVFQAVYTSKMCTQP